MLKTLYTELRDADKMWQERKRKITTSSVFYNLVSASVADKGLCHVLRRDESEYSHQALSKARSKLPQHIFKDINKKIQPKNGPRVYAIDGSKIHVPPRFSERGFTTRTNNKEVSRPAKHMLAMLSSMLDVDTRTCFDSIFHRISTKERLLRSICVLQRQETP